MTFAVDVCLVVTLEQTSEGSRSGLLAKCFLGSLGYQGQKTTLFEESGGLLAAAFGGKANTPVFS